VGEEELTPAERDVFAQTDAILALRGGRPERVREIGISETMRIADAGYGETAGLWEAKEHRIVVKRSELRSLETYAGTLLHEVAHAVSGTPDVSAAFEEALTVEAGRWPQGRSGEAPAPHSPHTARDAQQTPSS
jgi:hypothetical protein